MPATKRGRRWICANHETDMVPILGGPMPDTSSSPWEMHLRASNDPFFSLRGKRKVPPDQSHDFTDTWPRWALDRGASRTHDVQWHERFSVRCAAWLARVPLTHARVGPLASVLLAGVVSIRKPVYPEWALLAGSLGKVSKVSNIVTKVKPCRIRTRRGRAPPG